MLNILNSGRRAAELLGLIDAASNVGLAAVVDWAPRRVGFITPISTEPTTASIPTMATSSILPKFSFSETRCIMMASILFLRFAPLTPDRHFRGDSTYSLQT